MPFGGLSMKVGAKQPDDMDTALDQIRTQHKKLVAAVLGNVRNFTTTPNNQTILEAAFSSITEFVDSINWREEKWLQILVAFHIVMFLLIIATRNHKNIHAFFFILISGLVMSAQRMNKLAGDHWQQFATENYFDESGFFISTLFSVPLVLNATIILVIYLVHTARLLIQVKRKQLLHRHRQQASSTKSTKEKKE